MYTFDIIVKRQIIKVARITFSNMTVCAVRAMHIRSTVYDILYNPFRYDIIIIIIVSYYIRHDIILRQHNNNIM